MSFEQPNTRSSTTELLTVDSNNEILEVNHNQVPNSLMEMLQNKELLTCYKCNKPSDKEEDQELDSNNILLGIILNKKTPSSICLKCLSLRMMDVITEQFTKNSKDYEGLFFNY